VLSRVIACSLPDISRAGMMNNGSNTSAINVIGHDR
jgi:hypothetical protein